MELTITVLSIILSFLCLFLVVLIIKIIALQKESKQAEELYKKALSNNKILLQELSKRVQGADNERKNNVRTKR